MNGEQWLAERFEESRGRLRAIAWRMLGSRSEADDALQEAWLRVNRSGADGVQNMGGWLTMVVARVCLDMLRSRRSRREDRLTGRKPEPIATGDRNDPEQEALLADSVGLALLVVLDTLSPAERVAFVLHDLFDVPFDDIAPVLGRTPTAARQLASRGRRRVRGSAGPTDHGVERPDQDLARRREVVAAFLAASRDGDFEALLAVLDPQVVLRADAAAVRMGAAPEVRGAAAVARTFSGRAQAAQPALIDGDAGAVWAPGGSPRIAFVFAIRRGRIAGIEIIAGRERLARLRLSAG